MHYPINNNDVFTISFSNNLKLFSNDMIQGLKNRNFYTENPNFWIFFANQKKTFENEIPQMANLNLKRSCNIR